MKLLVDFFPILLFFIGYKFFGIYQATMIAIVASFVQIIFYRLKYQRFETMHVISFISIVVLGSATLFFHNPVFIKWKPTGIYWITALVFLGSSLLQSKPLIQKMMEANVVLPANIWLRLNYAWALFFLIMGAINLYVAYYYTTETWVNFKLFGGTGLTLVFVLLQASYLTRQVQDKTVSEPNQS